MAPTQNGAGRAAPQTPAEKEAALIADVGELRTMVQFVAQTLGAGGTPFAMANKAAGGLPAAEAPTTNSLAASLAALKPSERQATVEALVLKHVRALASEDVLASTPLQSAGLDSLAATELANALAVATGLTLPSTLVFEYPTPRAVATLIVQEIDALPTPKPVPGTAPPTATVINGQALMTAAPPHQEPVTLQSIAGRWPGGIESGKAAWGMLQASGDAVRDVPAARWTLRVAVDLDDYTDAQIQCASHGGFVVNAEAFDCKLFGISPAEAAATEPQQRLLLEVGYEAMHGTGARHASLLGSDVGVFVGSERPDWILYRQMLSKEEKDSVYAATGDTTSVASGRLSYCLGLHGPCVSIDTACSSALVALHQARLAVSGDECTSAVAAAAGLRLLPTPTLAAAAASMLSVNGRCKTWDAQANGYVRSEAVGATVVALGGEGGTLGASAVRQDGRSASLTAPNGSAQKDLLLAAWKMSAGAVVLGEAHGTGTALGDPTEAGALAAVVASGANGGVPLTMSAAKASVGHTEGTSGMVGLIRAMETLRRGGAAPSNALLKTINPKIGVSSFGYSGTIAHVVLCSSVSAKPSVTAAAPAGAAADAEDARVVELQKQMKKAVADEDFEQAGAIKKQLKARQATVAAEKNAAKNKEMIAAAGKAAAAPARSAVFRRRRFGWVNAKLSLSALAALPHAKVVAASRRAQDAIKQAVPPSGPPPKDVDVFIIGAGVSGLSVARNFSMAQQNLALVEKSHGIGGVWWHHANPFSRVNSSEPAYRLKVKRAAGEKNVDHSPHHEILSDLLRLVKQNNLLGKIFLGVAVSKVVSCPEAVKAPYGSGYKVTGTAWDGKVDFATTCRMVAVCTNRRLGAPRQLTYKGEDVFHGAVRRGLGGDVEGLQWEGKRVLIVGMGAFAIENMRTALERGAAHIHYFCRRRGTVCPQVVDWVNFIRPWDNQFKHFPKGDAVMFGMWSQAYSESSAMQPDCWKEGLLKPDGHTVSVSDLFFVAHYLKMASTQVGTVKELDKDGVVPERYQGAEGDGSTVPCDIIIKSIGFEVQAGNEGLLGRTHMRCNGLVDRNLWVQVEAHSDARIFNSPFGSSFLSGSQVAAQKMIDYWSDQALMTRVLALDLPLVRINSFNATDALIPFSFPALAEADPGGATRLRTHLESIAADFEDYYPLHEYLERNEQLWVALFEMLRPHAPNWSYWDYPFKAPLAQLEREGEGAHLAVGTIKDMHPAAARKLQLDDKKAVRRELPLDEVVLLVAKTTGGDCDADTPLTDAGLDSLGAVELRNALQKAVGAALPPTIVFDSPTPRMLTEALKGSAEEGVDGAAAGDGPSAKDDEAVAADVDTADLFLSMFEWNPSRFRAAGAICEAKSPEGANLSARAQTLFYLPGAPGVCVAEFAQLIEQLPCSVVGLPYARDAFTQGEACTVPLLAEALAARVTLLQPSPPYRLAGYSFGAVLALAVASVLEAKQRGSVAAVVLLDPPTLPAPKPKPPQQPPQPTAVAESADGSTTPPQKPPPPPDEAAAKQRRRRQLEGLLAQSPMPMGVYDANGAQMRAAAVALWDLLDDHIPAPLAAPTLHIRAKDSRGAAESLERFVAGGDEAKKAAVRQANDQAQAAAGVQASLSQKCTALKEATVPGTHLTFIADAALAPASLAPVAAFLSGGAK